MHPHTVPDMDKGGVVTGLSLTGSWVVERRLEVVDWVVVVMTMGGFTDSCPGNDQEVHRLIV